MQRIHRRDEEQVRAIHRLGLALAISVSLHSLFLVFSPGAGNAFTDASPLHARIQLPGHTRNDAFAREPAHAFQLQADDFVIAQSRVAVMQASGVIVDPRYYRAEELDVFPLPKRPLVAAEGFFVTGKVRLLTRIDASGRVVDVSVFDTDPAGASAGEVVQALRSAAFYPARKDSNPVRSEVVIEFAGKVAGG